MISVEKRLRLGVFAASLAIALLVGGTSNAADASEVWRSEVLRWIERMKSDQPITVKEFKWWNSNKDETELEFEESECEKRGWSISRSDERYVRYMRDREAAGDEAPSLFYAWLRTRLCTTCRVVIQRSERKHEAPPGGDYDLITVAFGKKTVSLAWYLDERHMDLAGRLPVVAIGGRPIREEMDAEMSRRRAEGVKARSKSSSSNAPKQR